MRARWNRGAKRFTTAAACANDNFLILHVVDADSKDIACNACGDRTPLKPFSDYVGHEGCEHETVYSDDDGHDDHSANEA
jgi:hypothetical protein